MFVYKIHGLNLLNLLDSGHSNQKTKDKDSDINNSSGFTADDNWKFALPQSDSYRCLSKQIYNTFLALKM